MSNDNRPRFTLGQLFTPEQLEKAAFIAAHYNRYTAGKSLAALLEDRVVKDAMPHIDQVTGQENHALYWAYVLEYAFTVAPNEVPPLDEQRKQMS